ncbi:MAG: hypothetical protein NTW19_05455 [Planctomycetota bacterium]|nr:hypothetical protein [Planctomycetota bacterium]
MTQDGTFGSARVAPRSNVYTVLMIIAALVLALGVGSVWYRSYQLTKSNNPLELPRSSQSR